MLESSKLMKQGPTGDPSMEANALGALLEIDLRELILQVCAGLEYRRLEY